MGLCARLTRRWCYLAAVLSLCAPFCRPDGDVPIQPVAGVTSSSRSLRCFEDGQVYSCCEGAYRLNPSGMIAVPPGEVDSYCGGACAVETEDVLNCVASALDGFRFYDGASVEDARYALRRGCSHTIKRGDFNDLEPQVGDYPDIYGDYSSDGGEVTTAPLSLLAFLGTAAWVLIFGR
ncbi:hypothetical protein GUJ93_ZPchr0013g35956 [Zizania palustris]|uniref:DUF7731 domain-containing protein n=1 Tax=Zizania palustris TaxID=103762 RepID=A0A8J5WTX7_ZIZPA|nr:hypothetical protein GUJ93_ZPchr0013g35956 [Zizania palustris]